mgnify:CR=1 FL=1
MPADRSNRVLLLEDEAVLCGLLAEHLRGQGYDVQACGTAAEATAIAERFKPTILVFDIELGSGPAGIDVAHALMRRMKIQALVFLTNLPEPRVAGLSNRSIPPNAAYLHKSRLTSPNVIHEAIEASLKRATKSAFRDDLRPQHRLAGMSGAQLDVLRMVALGFSNAEIAERRGTTLRAVENLMSRTYQAAGIERTAAMSERVQAARLFIQEAGMPSPQDTNVHD